MLSADRSKAVRLLWSIFVIYFPCLSLLCCLVCSLQTCDHLLARAYLLALLCAVFPCAFVIFLYGVRGQVLDCKYSSSLTFFLLCNLNYFFA